MPINTIWPTRIILYFEVCYRISGRVVHQRFGGCSRTNTDRLVLVHLAVLFVGTGRTDRLKYLLDHSGVVTSHSWVFFYTVQTTL